MRIIKYFLLAFLILASCKNVSKKEVHYTEIPPKPPRTKIFWLKDKTVNIQIDHTLSYSKDIKCDSVIGVNYIGFAGEHFFNPINEKGQYINTIIQTKKLNQKQISRLSTIIGNKKTYKDPNIAACYEPRLAFIYFKNDTVICQTQICLSCNQLHSSAHIADGADGNLNKEAVKKLTELHDELGFKEN
ncbi:hypothetical protein [Flavobacterium reichenbachii]|uniref:Lipoprotein n=1 Tax=Flavobacterium reichenbachii TaxID=362418 RepID=A0A085ZDC1_9FLAO|nr:hypothetical protein [Flavobacterium reichenbachii]KFF02435.1 hypothetical protein IW19_24400 [Flavobacterium reichenbachii]OXB13587.1 hypothetical protein B0A68_14650 [Flavobacterium reichenbachii]